jgi:hypothetical protein
MRRFVVVHRQHVVELQQVTGYDLPRAMLAVDRVLGQDSACPMVRRRADMPVARTGRVGVDLIAKAGRMDFVCEYGLGHGGSANIAEANEKNSDHNLIMRPIARERQPAGEFSGHVERGRHG